MIRWRRLEKWEQAVAAGILALAVSAAGAIRVHAEPVQASPELLGPTRIYDSREILLNAGTAALSFQPLEQPQRKSPQKAMLLSLLIPGLGEYWLGHRTRAYVFFGAEAATWTTYAVFQVQGGNAKDAYREWAELLAGVSPRDDDDFYRTVGNYVASDGPFSANEQIRREARSLYPNDRQAQERYLEENGYFGMDAWEWQSYDALDHFRDLRSESLDAYNRADLTLAVLIATRLISAVDSVILANKYNKGLEPDDGARLRMHIDAGPEGALAGLVMSRKF